MHEKAIPPDFTQIERGEKTLILRRELADELLRLGVNDLWDWAKDPEKKVHYYQGRVPAAAVTLPIEGGLRVVLRRYHHGGLWGKIQKDLYLFPFPPLREMAVCDYARTHQVPVAEILGVVQERVGKIFYRIDLITRHLPDGIDLGDYFKQNYTVSSWKEKREILKGTALLIRRMHDKGIYHADLHLKNIFMSQQNGAKVFYLLDFDKAHIVAKISPEMRLRNLLRLERYLAKYFSHDKKFSLSDRLLFLRTYFDSQEKAKEFIRLNQKRFRQHLRWHRLLWWKGFFNKDWWVYILLRGMIGFVNALPEQWAYSFSSLLAKVAYLLAPSIRRRIAGNLKRVYQETLSEKEVTALAKKNMKHLLYFAVEVIRSFSETKKELRQAGLDFEVVGGENIEEGLRRGKGILFLVSHFGNWERLSLIGLRYPFTVYALVKTIKNRWIDQWVSDVRTRFGINVLKAGKLNRDVFKILKQNNAMCLLIDQSPGAHRGEILPFMGIAAPTNTAPAYFALKSGATILPAYAIRKTPGKFKVVIEPPVELIQKEDLREALMANTELFNQGLEKYIRQYPEQWFWVHNRWKKSKK